MKQQNLYNILGVSNDADTNEIIKRYKTLAKTMHPDKLTNPNKDEINKFQELTNAYNILSDNERRTQYDAELNMDHGFTMGDLFESFHMSFSTNPKTIVVNVLLNMKEVYNGCVKNVKYSRKINCGVCHGEGGINKKICTVCHGQSHFMNVFSNVNCRKCNGIGYTTIINCSNCSGSGFHTEQVEKSFKFHTGVNNKKTYLIQNAGNQNNYKFGDVKLVINHEDHKCFSQKGNNLLLTLYISFYDSFTSKKFEFLHLDDEIKTFMTDEVIDPTKVYQMEGLGFKGENLLIIFKIKYPKHSDLKLKF